MLILFCMLYSCLRYVSELGFFVIILFIKYKWFWLGLKLICFSNVLNLVK